jgi:hypothetical protein
MKMDIRLMFLQLFPKLKMKKGATRKRVSDVNADIKKQETDVLTDKCHLLNNI